MKKLLRRTLIAVLTITMAACTSVEDPPGGGGSGGSAGTGGTGGTAGTGGTSGTGGTGGTDATPTVTLTATPISVANGTIALLSWDVTNATACDAQGDDWEGTRLADGGPEERFIYKNSRFELLCTGPGGTGSDEVDVSINTSQLLVSVDMDFYLVKAGDNFNVDVTVSNPGAQMVQNAFVTLVIPQYVIINPAALPSNATCTGACDAGEMIEWDIGAVDAGTVTVVSVEPEVALTVPDGEDIEFEVTTSADGEPDEVVSESTTEGESDLGLGLAQTPSEPQAGEGLVYTLSYDNSGPSPLSNVELTLTLPGPVAFVSANNGGTISDGVVTWTFTELAAGANGEVEARVDVNPTIPPGAQLRAAAGALVDGTPAGARATTLGSVGAGSAECQIDDDCPVGDFCVDSSCTPPLLAEVVIDAGPVLEGETFQVSATITNPTTTETVNDVEVKIQVPQGVNNVPTTGISSASSPLPAGATCGNSGACAPGTNIVWQIGSLAPGESRVVTLLASAASESAASAISFDANATSTNSKSASGEAMVDVVAARPLNLRMVESANPVATDESLTYTLHYANQSNSTISNATLMLTTPSGTTVTDTGGGTDAQGVITWDLGTLGSGEGGTRSATVTVNAATGQQLRAEAVVFDTGDPAEQSRATAQTPVGASPLIALVEVNPDPGRQNETTHVSVTVTNPSASTTRNDIAVQIRVPQGVNNVPTTGISSASSPLPAGATCGNSGACAPGTNIVWQIGDLAPRESRVVWLEPTIANATVDGSVISYQADVREDALTSATAVEQTAVLASGAMLVQGSRNEETLPLNLRMVESANPVATDESLTYTLHYANQSNSTISNATLMLTTPSGTTVTDTGGGTDAQGVITWDLDTLGSGEGGTRSATVTVNAATGQQLRAEAVVFDTGDPTEQSRATAQTPVGDSPLMAVVEVNPDPARQGETTHVSVTVTNPSASTTRNDIAVQIRVPQGVNNVPTTGISSASSPLPAGATCGNSGACAPGTNIVWQIGDLAPRESRVVWLEPTIANATVDGSVISYQADVREDALTSATAVEQTAVLASGAMLVQGSRNEETLPLNLRMVESANPVATDESLTYTLHYANQSNSTISNATLMLTTPSGTTVTDTGGGTDAQGVITWDLDTLGSGDGGTRSATVTVNAATGQQLRAEAVVFDTGDPAEQSRATAQTPVGASPLIALVEVNPDPGRQNEATDVTVTVTNPSTSTTVNDIAVHVRVPQGVNNVPTTAISSGATCGNSGACAPGTNIVWQIGDLAPEESRMVSLTPTIANATVDGSVISYQADVREDALTSATAVEQTAVLGGNTVRVEPTP